MSLINISETQLAFGYLHSYLNVYRPRRFMLPSIQQEGGLVRFPYPGADLIINNNHLIQFKRPFYFTTNGIKEFRYYTKPADINPPYYRFYIKNDNPTNQLDNLLRATLRGIKAEYISPMFNQESTFSRLLKNDVLNLQNYAHIDISQFSSMLTTIGHNNEHTIIYNETSVLDGFCYCFSEPKKMRVQSINLNKSYDNEMQRYSSFEIIKVISTIFFEGEDIVFNSNNPLYQCRVLQNKLFVERDIIWHFNFMRL